MHAMCVPLLMCVVAAAAQTASGSNATVLPPGISSPANASAVDAQTPLPEGSTPPALVRAPTRGGHIVAFPTSERQRASTRPVVGAQTKLGGAGARHTGDATYTPAPQTNDLNGAGAEPWGPLSFNGTTTAVRTHIRHATTRAAAGCGGNTSTTTTAEDAAAFPLALVAALGGITLLLCTCGCGLLWKRRRANREKVGQTLLLF